MTILITGSNGKTASNLSHLLAPTHSIIVASRRPNQNAVNPTVRFDWLDRSTWELPFSHEQAKKSPITAAYLVSPDVPQARDSVIPFVHLAVKEGVKRFVLLSAWEVPEWGPLMGQAHGQLKAMQEDGIEWTVLRPHFFMENFAEPYHLPCIKHESKIYTAAGDGRKPYISAKDIAAVACLALTDESPHNTDYVLTGDESLTYDDVAATLTEVLGRKIEHVKLSKEELKQKLHTDFSYSESFAEYMADLDVQCSQGVGSAPTQNVAKLIGRSPLKLKEIIAEQKNVWAE